MNTYPTEFLCVLCSTPINLTTDLNADENGHAVHEKCYVDKLTGKKNSFIRLWAMSPIYRTPTMIGTRL